MATQKWGTDTPVSMPVPMSSAHTPLIDMGGFCFTQTGLMHAFTIADLEAYLYPTYRPIPTAATQD